MERWNGRVAVVTGASSGIGAAIAKDLAKAGMITIGLARRVERVEELRKDLSEDAAKRLHALKCDVSKEADVDAVFKSIEEKFGGCDVLVNNAGIMRSTNLLDVGNTSDIKAVLDTNVTGLVLCSQRAYQSMVKRSVDGHIVHISSIAGHMVPNFPKLNVYSASKHAVKAITETMRQEMRDAGKKIKVTSVSPGGVRTEFLNDTGIEISDDWPMLRSEDVSDAVLYTLGTPPHVQVHEIIIKPMGEAM
ncbi:farnesol dehydrogenase-like [Anopheles cruzii]|uniref:farnesol dehydrogenase-like n=2 Tax=Anopheles cruzii TaxID=68878 RepID=UPI0022EC7A2B|nr:farnesol dehydrogenase-like [Anopheles cruzii]